MFLCFLDKSALEHENVTLRVALYLALRMASAIALLIPSFCVLLSFQVEFSLTNVHQVDFKLRKPESLVGIKNTQLLHLLVAVVAPLLILGRLSREQVLVYIVNRFVNVIDNVKR